jgi:hypothetical protein
MNQITVKANQIHQTLIEEEFRFWDAKRNLCQPKVLEDISKNIESAKADLIALEIFFQQVMLS